MRVLVAAVASLFLVGASAAPMGQEEVQMGPEQDYGPQDDPVIWPGEVIAPSIDSQDTEWAPWSWYGDPASVDCVEAPAWCEAGAGESKAGVVA